MSAALSSSRHPIPAALPIPHSGHLLQRADVRAFLDMWTIGTLRWQQMQRDGIPIPTIPRKSKRARAPLRTLD